MLLLHSIPGSLRVTFNDAALILRILNGLAPSLKSSMPMYERSVATVQEAHQEEGHNEGGDDADAREGVGINAHVGLGCISIKQTCPC